MCWLKFKKYRNEWFKFCLNSEGNFNKKMSKIEKKSLTQILLSHILTLGCQKPGMWTYSPLVYKGQKADKEKV